MSRSCQSATSSSAGTTAARTTRARPHRFSLRMGLRLWGMALEPFWPTVKASSASPTSLRCQCRTLVARRSIPAATSASAAKYAAWRSRATTCVATVSGSSPRAASACLSMAGDRWAYVPTAPAILPTAISRRAASSRARPRAISAWCPARARPNVTGSAKMPWLRPIIGVVACSRARSRRAARSLSHRSSSLSAASRSRIASDVSSTSLDVIPR